ncbi:MULTISPECIES: zinc-dependent alcohol dehydrogenase [unclassified Marinobacter]|uniref:zinc-dependent alcohol dehydrogenase n=1 Tax=unclassified Marinobacter TaxID=83889 RepID=UPI001905B77C|nr:zinc-binding alcohol dehydrogenase [Marinobacter sp. 1-4A]MBK1849853.1 zinc-binding alcohol dehydrogenase [Marinobacter sp. 1-4A]
MSSDSNQPSEQPTPRAFWVTGPGEACIRETPEHHRPLGSGEPWVAVQTLWSGVSRGTESLVFHGRIPQSELDRMRAPFQEGAFPWPVKYGYANVGRVVEGPDELVGRTVFCLYPHQTHYSVPASAVTPIPNGVPPERAILAANMETAINGLWDAMPAVGDRIAVIGLGVVGLLVSWLASRIPGTQVTAIDSNPGRAKIAEALGLSFATESSVDTHDLVVHASGNESGLNTALALAGQDATLLEMSWYGDKFVSVPLGASFHSRRLRFISSQVGQLPPARVPRWTHRKRLELALELLQHEVLDHLISGETPFEQMPETMNRILAGASDTLCHRIKY